MNNMIKKLIFMVSVMVIAACSTQKHANNQKYTNNNDEFSMNAHDSTNIGMNNNNMLTDERLHLQMQNLQDNNVFYFDLDKDDIRSEFTQILDEHASFLCRNPCYKIIIEGHADERGTSEYNIALGERRANSVKNYLRGKGVSADQITIVSYGKEKLAVLGHDENSHTKNRRAVLIY